MEPDTAYRDWNVKSRMISRRPGEAVVTITLRNGVIGTVPDFNIRLDWKPGMEAVDVEMLALAMVATSAEALHKAAIDAGSAKAREAG